MASLQEELSLKATGLHTYQDQLSQVPEGSLRTASNVVADRDGLYSPRRGYQNLPGSASVGQVLSLHTYTEDRFNYLLAHTDNAEVQYYDDTTDTWTAYVTGLVKPTNANTIKTAQANKNLYLTSENGIQKLDTIAGDLEDAGAPAGLNATTTEVNAGTGSVFGASGADDSVGYRIVWGVRDAQNNLILGAPSNRVVHVATSNNSDVELTINIPAPPVDTSWFVQVYRTAVAADVAATPQDPGDDMQLVIETNPDGTDISNGFIVVTDSTPDELRGAALYTNALQQGILQANFQPPKALDIALYQNHMFYANTETKYTLTATLLAVDSTGVNTNALTLDDTITVGGITYTGKAAEDAANDEFLISTSPSLSDRIADTAQSIVNVVNRSPSNTTLWAYYDSGENDLPGRIRFEERDFGDAVDFTFDSDRDTAWSPSPTSPLESTNERRPNRLFYSKFQQPEAVPILNFFEVGAENDEILRIVPLRANLLIFTTNGIYNMTGTTESQFNVRLLDSTAILQAPDSMVSFNNTAIGFFDQGVAQVSGSQVQVISRAIEGELNEIRGDTPDKLAELAFGITYESDRKYLLALPTSNTDTKAQIVYVFNSITRSWTTYDLAKQAGIVRFEDDKLYWAEDNSVIVERKSFDDSDYAEPETAVEALSVNGTEIELSTTSGFLVGYQYFEDAGKFSIIEAIDTDTNIITVQDDLNFDFTRYKLTVTLDTNLSIDDTITVDGVTYTAKAVQDNSSREFAVGVNEASTVINLREAVNNDPGTVDVEADVTAGQADITFQENAQGVAPAFTVTSSNGSAWSPDLSGFVASTEETQDSEVRPYIVTEMEWNPIYADSPNILKQFSEVTLLVNKPITEATIGYRTLISSGFDELTVSDESNGPWGLFPWGEVPWGGLTSLFRYRTWVPREKQRDSAIILKVTQNTIFNEFLISGWSIIYRNISQRVTR